MTLKNNLAVGLVLTAVSLWSCAPQHSESVDTNATAQASASVSDWTLLPEESGMTYITLKNGELAETNTFRNISGTVTSAGDAKFTIDLASVDTNNEVRDGRMREILFKIDIHPEAVVTSKIDMDELTGLEVGESHTLLLDMNITLHGYGLQRDFYVLATRLADNKVVVSNKAPLILHAEEFGFEDSLEELRNLAMLDSITPVVTVTLSLTFGRDDGA